MADFPFPGLGPLPTQSSAQRQGKTRQLVEDQCRGQHQQRSYAVVHQDDQQPVPQGELKASSGVAPSSPKGESGQPGAPVVVGLRGGNDRQSMAERAKPDAEL